MRIYTIWRKLSSTREFVSCRGSVPHLNLDTFCVYIQVFKSLASRLEAGGDQHLDDRIAFGVPQRHALSPRRRAVRVEHRAREIERAGSQDARRGLEAELRDGGERGVEVISALRGDADRARRIGDDRGGKTLLLPRDRHRHDAARKPREIFQKTLAILTRHHADHEHERARKPLLEIGERIGDGARAIRVLAALPPKLAPP